MNWKGATQNRISTIVDRRIQPYRDRFDLNFVSIADVPRTDNRVLAIAGTVVSVRHTGPLSHNRFYGITRPLSSPHFARLRHSHSNWISFLEADQSLFPEDLQYGKPCF